MYLRARNDDFGFAREVREDVGFVFLRIHLLMFVSSDSVETAAIAEDGGECIFSYPSFSHCRILLKLARDALLSEKSLLGSLPIHGKPVGTGGTAVR